MEDSSNGMMNYFPTEWKNKIHVPNHQPVMISYDIRTIHSMYLPLGYGKTHEQ